MRKKFYLNFYIGVGVRIKRFKYINLEYDKFIHQTDFSDTFSIFEFGIKL
jgi:hypothetical protein